MDAAVPGDALDFLDGRPPAGVRGLFIVDRRMAQLIGRDSGYEFSIVAEFVDPGAGVCLCPECWEPGAGMDS